VRSCHVVESTTTNGTQRHQKNKAKRVYDTGDPRKPEKDEWFTMQTSDTRWPDDVVGKRPKVERCYDSEHVLEWHLMKDFLEEDKAKGADSRCAYMDQYFLKDLPKKAYKVKAAKDDGKLTNGKFTFEDKQLDFTKWNVKGHPTPRIIDYISK